jgi:hypothetical protein
MPAPKPVPGARSTIERLPRPAPNIHSPSARALQSLSTKVGRPKRAASIEASGWRTSSGT